MKSILFVIEVAAVYAWRLFVSVITLGRYQGDGSPRFPEFHVPPPAFLTDGSLDANPDEPMTEKQFAELQDWMRREKAARDAAGDSRPIFPPTSQNGPPAPGGRTKFSEELVPGDRFKTYEMPEPAVVLRNDPFGDRVRISTTDPKITLWFPKRQRVVIVPTEDPPAPEPCPPFPEFEDLYKKGGPPTQ